MTELQQCPAVLTLDRLHRFPMEGTECTLPMGHAGEHHHDAVWMERKSCGKYIAPTIFQGGACVFPVGHTGDCGMVAMPK